MAKFLRDNELTIAMITSPYLLSAGITPVSNLLKILSLLSQKVFIFTGGAGASLLSKDYNLILINRTKCQIDSKLRFSGYIYNIFKISYLMLILNRKVDIWIFFLGERPLIIPILISRILKNQTVLMSSGSMKYYTYADMSYTKKLLDKLLIELNLILPNKIIVYSIRLIEKAKFDKYRNKIIIGSEHFLDLHNFREVKTVSERDLLVGYIGRLSEEKGIKNFLDSIPIIKEINRDVQFIICGDGVLSKYVSDYLELHKLNKSVKLTGWVPHNKLPNYLNNFKLIVMPSYTEGLPNVMLESMACGTPILATPVGTIPDIINDGTTGFIMENNLPECIAANMLRALEHPDLEGIARRARTLVEREFTFEGAVERWRVILDEICHKDQ